MLIFLMIFCNRYAPDLYLKKVSGASAGAIAAACLLCDAPLGTKTKHNYYFLLISLIYE